jgi:molecular chaperone DnaK
VLVFDLGGGTFDATLMTLKNKQVKVLATGGDAFLGGGNFDALIAEKLVDCFQQRHGLDLRDNRVVMQRLAFAAEGMKIALSTAPEKALRIPCVAQKDGKFLDLDYKLTRPELEEMVVPLVERCSSACDDVLARASLKPEQVDELVLVGGQTRMPAVRNRLTHFKRFSSDKDVHPELGVAIGAAILGRNLARGVTGLMDVAPMPISLMLPGGSTLEVIPANTPVPCSKRVKLEGLPPWQAPVPVAIFESLDRTSIDREVFGTVLVGAEWRVGKAGAPSLQLELGQDFTLRARLSSPDGREAAVGIVEARSGGKT